MGGWKTASEVFLAVWAVRWIAPVVTVITGLAAAFGALATSVGAVDVAAGGGGIKWLLGLLGGAGGAAILAALGAAGLGIGTRIGPAGDDKEEKRQLGGSFHERFPGLVVPDVNAQAFHDKTYSDLLAEAQKRNLLHPEVIASLGAAQASVESGGGTSDLFRRANNPFGIKPGTPGGVGENGQSGAYVSFDSREAAAAGYLDFIMKNRRYAGVLGAGSVPEAARSLAGAGYAEDPNYEKAIGDAHRRYGGIRTAPRIPPTGPAFGPQPVPGAPQYGPFPVPSPLDPRLQLGAIDPSWRYASRSPAYLRNNSSPRSLDQSRSSEVNIASLVVNATPGNAEGVAKGIGAALKATMTPHHADYGLS